MICARAFDGTAARGLGAPFLPVAPHANRLETLPNFDNASDLCKLTLGYGVCVMAYNWERAPNFRERHPNIIAAGKFLAGLSAVIAVGYVLTL